MSALLGLVIVIVLVLSALVALALVVLRRWLLAAWSAEAVLREFLTEGEYRHLRATGYLEVASPMQPGRIYRVPREHGRVLILEGGRPTEQLCIEPLEHNLPDADVVLLHKLLIQADEEYYLRTANHFGNPVWWLAGSGQEEPGSHQNLP
jgi:hypothetical protein